MKLRIRTADQAWMSATWAELDLLKSESIHNVKVLLVLLLPRNFAKVHLIYGGHVLSDDDATLHELGIVEFAQLWALRSSERMTAFSLEQIHRICPLPHFEAHSGRASHDDEPATT